MLTTKQDNIRIFATERAYQLNDVLDCDVIHSCIVKLRNMNNLDGEQDPQETYDALEELKSAIDYRSNDRRSRLYIKNLVNEFALTMSLASHVTNGNERAAGLWIEEAQSGKTLRITWYGA